MLSLSYPTAKTAWFNSEAQSLKTLSDFGPYAFQLVASTPTETGPLFK